MSSTAIIQEFLCGHITFATLQSQFNLQQYIITGIITTIITIIFYCKFYIRNKSAIFFGIFLGFIFPYFCQLWYISALMPFMLWYGAAKMGEGPTLCLSIMGIYLIIVIIYAIIPRKSKKKKGKNKNDLDR